MTMKSSKLRDAIVLALVVGSTTVGATGLVYAADNGAAAQDQQAQQTDEEQQQDQQDQQPVQLTTVTVTGTRIQSQTVTESSPITEIEAEEFQYSGATRVEDLVNQFPQMSPAFDSMNNNPSLGYPTVNLRGLGANRTLTLVNGLRLAPGASELRDISIVPTSIVRRVDLLTGGASAVYGADAVAGVVNFILDDEFEGVSVTAGWSGYQHNNDNEYIQGLMDKRSFDYPTGSSGFGGISRNIDVAMGGYFADGRGHGMAWATYRENQALFQGERDYSSCALNNSGTACGGSATNAAGDFYVFQFDADGDFLGGTSASVNPDGSFADHYGAPYNYAPANYYQRPDQRRTFGAQFKLEINENFIPYAETMFINKRDAVELAPSGAFFTLVDPIECDDPLIGTMCSDLGFDTSLPVGVYVAKRNVEGGPRHTDSDTTQYRIVAGLGGAIGSSPWSYDMSFLYGQTSADTQGFNDFLSDRIVDAIRGCPAGSFSGCLPYNVFQPPGSVTPESAAALAGVSMTKTRTDLMSVNAYITGPLNYSLPWAGGDPINLVVGVEHREETYNFTADSNSQAGNFAGAGGPAVPLSGKTQVSEMFAEASVPVFKDFGIFDSLGVDLGYRVSDYQRAGKTDTYKLGFNANTGIVRVRAGYNRAIRAPNIGELFAGQQIALFSGEDPCAGPDPEMTAAQCANTGVPLEWYGRVASNPASQYNQFAGGNPDLKPEKADTYTFGVVVTPTDDFRFNVDYYDIRLEDAISTVGANVTLRFCGLTGDPFLCDRIHRNASTYDLFRGSDPATSGYVTNLIDNFGEREFRGIDIGGAYRWDMLGGRFETNFQGNYVLNEKISPLPGVNDEASYDCAGQINLACQSPEWRHIANLRYSRSWYTVGARWRYFGEMDYVDEITGEPLTTDKLVSADGGIDAVSYLDLSASARIGDNTEITVGVNNVLDKEPPLVGGSLVLNGNAPGGYDQAGRFVFGSVNFRF